MNDNIDIKEINKFSAYAKVWWDTSGPLAPLHAINNPRLEFIKRYTSLSNKNILDIGCGAGILTESLAKKNANVVGIDASREILNVAKEHSQLQNLTIKYFHNTIEEYIEKHDEKFELITCMELIEHVPNPSKLLKNCSKLLQPGGKIFLSTINRTMKAYVYAILGAEYIFNILPKRTHKYKKFIKPAEIQQLMIKHHLDLKDLAGISYNPFTKYSALCSNVNINYLAYAIKD